METLLIAAALAGSVRLSSVKAACVVGFVGGAAPQASYTCDGEARQPLTLVNRDIGATESYWIAQFVNTGYQLKACLAPQPAQTVCYFTR